MIGYRTELQRPYQSPSDPSIIIHSIKLHRYPREVGIDTRDSFEVALKNTLRQAAGRDSDW